MPQGTRICKVCGKEYPYCKTNRPTNIFRFQDVACSPECGSIYFERVEKSRSKAKTSNKAKKATKVKSVVVEDSSKEKIKVEDSKSSKYNSENSTVEE